MFTELGGCVSRCVESFLFDLFVVQTSHAMSFVLHIVCWFSVGRFIWLRDRESGSSWNLCFDLIWFFSGVPGARGVLLIWCYSLVGRSLLIQDRESVL